MEHMQKGPGTISLIAREGASVDEPSELGLLFHRLNNQLGIILANAELLEAKLADEAQRARASQVVASALDALTTAKELRIKLRP